jgi:hypothetical protein
VSVVTEDPGSDDQPDDDDPGSVAGETDPESRAVPARRTGGFDVAWLKSIAEAAEHAGNWLDSPAIRAAAEAVAAQPAWLQSIFGQIEDVRKLAIPGLGRMAFDQLAITDAFTPAVLRAAEVASTAQLAGFAFPDTAIAAWRTTLASEEALGRLIAGITLPFPPEVLDSLSRSISVTTELARWVAEHAPDATVLRGITRPALNAYNSYLTVPPAADQAWMAVHAGNGVGGLLGAELLTGELVDREDEAVSRVHLQVIQPWRQAPQAARERLHAVLADLDPGIPELLDGAWAEAVDPGPAAKTKLATCAVEALDRALRAAAPVADVRRWWAETNVTSEVDEKDRPTRSARVKFVLRARPGDRTMVDAQVSALATLSRELVSRLQAAKHSSASSQAAAEACLLAVEALLHQLFLVDP